MLAAQEPNRKRRPPKMFLLSTDLKVQDELEGTIRLQRGNICQEQEAGRGGHPWVKVLDSGSMIRIERKFLLEVPANLVGLLEPVPDPEARFKLLGNPGKLQQLAELGMGAPLWVQTGHTEELLEAELRYIGPLTQGGSAVFFGVQLKGAAAGRGVSNGSVNGRRLFSCPEACALFVPVSQVRPRRWSRSANAPEAQQERGRERDHAPLRATTSQPPADAHHGNAHHGNAHHGSQPHGRHISFRNDRPETSAAPVGVLARTAAAAAHGPAAGVRGPASPPPFHIGQRVCFPLDESVERGEVRYCGPLPGRSSSGMYVGIVLDAPVGNWDGYYKGEKLCHVPLPIYGLLLPLSKVSAESKPPRHSGPAPSQPPKSILKPLPPVSASGPPSPPISGPKVALMPPGRAVAKGPPPLPPPKPVHSLPPPPLPPPKPHAEPPQRSNGEHSPLRSPLRSPGGNGETHVENGEAAAEGELEVGSMVEVNDPPLFGVIRWVGHISGIPEPVAGIELDQELSAGTDGSYLGERHFRCPANKGLFVKLRNCRRDSRFPAPETPVNQVERCNSIAFAEWGSERVEEHTPPLEGDEALQLYQGWKRGIQGHLNSCYLDATLFSLFSCCNSADWLLFWPAEDHPHHSSHQAQDLLRCDIVNPLRRFGYVCASKTMALRRLLEADNSDAGFTNQEKDPEEFLNKLFQLLRVEPLLKIRSVSRQPQQCHLYQLFPPPPSPSPCPSPTSPSSPSVGSPLPLASPLPARMRVASVQALLESSFLHGGLKFVEAPSSLLLLMPRFGKDFKMFDAILPSLSLDITDLLDDTLRQCSICQAVAEWECLQCYEDLDITPGRLKQYCNTCNTQVHAHRKRASHAPLQIGVPGGPWSEPPPCSRRRMSLFAVTCIETSHYVSFVKHGPHAADWLFFDSMADREGGENGFNVPRVKPCPEVGRYLGLSEEELGRLEAGALRESARRLLCDAYMCLYHSPELSLYK